MDIEKGKLIWIYKTMVRHREFENAVLEGFEDGKIPGFAHLGQGQEAIGAGAIAAMRDCDYIGSTTHRTAHGHLIARGEPMNSMMAELYGKKTGTMKGKGGCMHFADASLRIFPCDGMLGTGCDYAPGVALSSKLKGKDEVTLSFFGDGVLNTGCFHEGVNLASAWKLPIVFICENNKYGDTTSIYDVTNLTELTDRAVGYGIPAVSVDGNDAIAVYEAVSEAIERARNGHGPSFIECKTCRWRGHFEGDPQLYRPDQEVEECKKKDPIVRLRKKLLSMGIITNAEIEKIQQSAVDEVRKAVAFAEESEFPGSEELLTDIYA
jgi:TPP-dependent pyruvate/acetoin dehydrogenase alpha subunit